MGVTLQTQDERPNGVPAGGVFARADEVRKVGGFSLWIYYLNHGNPKLSSIDSISDVRIKYFI